MKRVNVYRVSVLLRPKAAGPDEACPSLLRQVHVYALDPDEACSEGELAALVRWPGFRTRNVLHVRQTEAGDEVRPSGRKGRQP